MIKINKSEFCKTIHLMIMEIRLEYNLSQTVMANMIGVSKKTYIQLEKQRIILKWSEAVTISTIFKDSKTIVNVFGDDIISIIHLISFEKPIFEYQNNANTSKMIMINKENKFLLQQDKISKLYRITDQTKLLVYISFSETDIKKKYHEIILRNCRGDIK
ncbi:MAG: hypothetical protein QM489_07205 [Candidatus Izemoplasma sp.]